MSKKDDILAPGRRRPFERPFGARYSGANVVTVGWGRFNAVLAATSLGAAFGAAEAESFVGFDFTALTCDG